MTSLRSISVALLATVSITASAKEITDPLFQIRALCTEMGTRAATCLLIDGNNKQYRISAGESVIIGPQEWLLHSPYNKLDRRPITMNPQIPEDILTCFKNTPVKSDRIKCLK